MRPTVLQPLGNDCGERSRHHRHPDRMLRLISRLHRFSRHPDRRHRSSTMCPQLLPAQRRHLHLHLSCRGELLAPACFVSAICQLGLRNRLSDAFQMRRGCLLKMLPDALSFKTRSGVSHSGHISSFWALSNISSTHCRLDDISDCMSGLPTPSSDCKTGLRCRIDTFHQNSSNPLIFHG